MYINSMNIELLKQYAAQGLSQRKIAELEHCSQTKVSRYFRKYGLKKNRVKLEKQCLTCHNILKKRQVKFCSNACQGIYYHNKYINDILSGNKKINVNNNRQLRRYVLATRKHICEICQNTLWNLLPIPLVVDHIDGNYTNISPENLRLICPNCDAQLPTYKGKNRGNGRYQRRDRYKRDQSY